MKLKRSKNKMIERFLQGFLIIILTIFMMNDVKEMQELLTMQALFEERHKEKLS